MKHFIAVLIINLIFLSSNSFAGHDESNAHRWGTTYNSYHYWNLKDFAEFQFKIIFGHSKQLDLTSDQLYQLEELELESKDDVLKEGSQIELISMEINMLIVRADANEEALLELLEKKNDIVQHLESGYIEIFFKIKNVLTESQISKLTDLWNGYKETAGYHSSLKSGHSYYSKKHFSHKTKCPFGKSADRGEKGYHSSVSSDEKK